MSLSELVEQQNFVANYAQVGRERSIVHKTASDSIFPDDD